MSPDVLRLLWRTSNFRFALRSLALSLGGAVLVFGIIHHAAALAWRGAIDDALAIFDEALAQADQALEIFAAMLRIAEVEAGSRRAHFTQANLSALLTMLAESYEPSFAAAGISLRSDIASALTLQGDPELLAQLFTNLLDNVILHAQGATAVSIEAARQGDAIVVAIVDNGHGIPRSEVDHVLQRFVRLDASRHRPGHGLGLPLALAIAALHDAAITLADNAPGLRVIVTFRQPKAS